MKRKSLPSAQHAKDDACEADPYAVIPPPSHPGHKNAKWEWHPFNTGPLTALQRQAMYDNPWLVSGHRPYGHLSYMKCLKSLFSLHNDTMNVYTHLFGSLYFLYHGTVTFMRLHELEASMADRLVFLAYALLVTLCFFMSAYYHLMRSHSHSVYRKLLTLDIAGIALCISAADLLVSHFEMRCHVSMRPVYATVVFILLGAALFYVPTLVKYRRTNQRTLIMAAIGCIPLCSLIHRLSMSGGLIAVDQATTVRCLVALLYTYGWLVLGLAIRRLKLPERMVPRLFDLIGASHQLFHICTIIGTAYLFWAYVSFYEDGVIQHCVHTISQQQSN